MSNLQQQISQLPKQAIAPIANILRTIQNEPNQYKVEDFTKTIAIKSSKDWHQTELLSQLFNLDIFDLLSLFSIEICRRYNIDVKEKKFEDIAKIFLSNVN